MLLAIGKWFINLFRIIVGWCLDVLIMIGHGILLMLNFLKDLFMMLCKGIGFLVCMIVFSLSSCTKSEYTNVPKETVRQVSDNAVAETVRAAHAEIQTIEEKTTTDGGGNEYIEQPETKEVRVAILVSTEEYYYNNLPISIEQIVKMLSETEGNIIVSITDNNATLKAYKQLTDKLTELEVSYEELIE